MKNCLARLIAGLTLMSCPTGMSHAGTGAWPELNIELPTSRRLSWSGECGTASYYGAKWDGRRSASGLRFDQRLLTAAHAWLPFGTKVKVTLGGSERSVIVVITDRLRSRGRVLDLSAAAARELGIIRRGLAEVSIAPA